MLLHNISLLSQEENTTLIRSEKDMFYRFNTWHGNSKFMWRMMQDFDICYGIYAIMATIAFVLNIARATDSRKE